MSDLLFSVVIPTYNQAQWLSEAVASALAQGREDTEVIVVDDGSTDETPEVLRAFADRALIIRQENAGVSAARNRGLEAGQGRWIAFLDGDDRWRPGHLDRLARAIAERPEAGLIFTDAMVMDEDGRELKARRSPDPGRDPFRSFLLENPVTTSAAAVRREALQKTGKFCLDLKGPEDWDLWLRLALDFPVVHLPELSVNYRRQSQGLVHTRGVALREDTFKAMERISALVPDLPASLLRRARFNRYLESAVRLLAGEDIRTARRELISALREDPFGVRAWLLLAFSLGGKSLVQAALKWRQSREQNS